MTEVKKEVIIQLNNRITIQGGVMSEYSSLKIIHHPEKLSQLRNGFHPVPAQVQLIISDLCNQDCSFCAYRMSGYTSNQLFTLNAPLAAKGHNNPVRMIPYEKVVEILDSCVALGVGAIQLTGGGEPSVHPEFPQILRDINDRGLDLALVTNGLKITEDVFDELKKAKWVRFSIDAGSAETYSAVRNVSKDQYKRVWDNIHKFCLLDKETTVGIGYVVTVDNWSEIDSCCNKAFEVGADNVRISAVFQNEGEAYFSGIYKDILETIATCERKYHTSNLFKVINRFTDRVEDLVQKSPDYELCGYQHFCTYIGGDLSVYRCCNTAYNNQGLVGSIKDQSFEDFWHSIEKRDKYEEFNAKTCERCQFNQINKTILYTLEEDPVHVNFV